MASANSSDGIESTNGTLVTASVSGGVSDGFASAGRVDPTSVSDSSSARSGSGAGKFLLNAHSGLDPLSDLSASE